MASLVNRPSADIGRIITVQLPAFLADNRSRGTKPNREPGATRALRANPCRDLTIALGLTSHIPHSHQLLIGFFPASQDKGLASSGSNAMLPDLQAKRANGGPPLSDFTREYAQSLDAQDPLRHFRQEFLIPSKNDLKKKTLALPDGCTSNEQVFCFMDRGLTRSIVR